MRRIKFHSPDGNRGNVSAESCGKRPEHSEDYRLKLQRLGETCYNLGCSKGDVRKVLMIENIAMDDSPIWQLIEELKASGGRYSFTGDVLPALWGLVKTGRLQMMEEHTDEVKEGVHNVGADAVGYRRAELRHGRTMRRGERQRRRPAGSDTGNTTIERADSLGELLHRHG